MNLRRHQIPEPVADGFGNDIGASLPVMPGFREMALRRSADEQAARMAEERGRLVRELAEQRQVAGLSQTEVAARMGTSQSAVARLESGTADVRASTLERYAAAVGSEITWKLNRPGEPGEGASLRRHGRRRTRTYPESRGRGSRAGR